MSDIQKYKEELEKELETLRTELSAIGINDPANPSDWIAVPEEASPTADPNDAADRVEEWDERRSIVATLETRYNNVTSALKRIGEGTFGICEVGGEAIEEDRLEANPAARTCKAHMNEESTLS